MNTRHRTDVEYPKSSAGTRIAVAVAAVLVSASLMGSVLGLFEQRSRGASVARAPVPAPATAVVGLSDTIQQAGTQSGPNRS